MLVPEKQLALLATAVRRQGRIGSQNHHRQSFKPFLALESEGKVLAA